jgi:hypothetical protein
LKNQIFFYTDFLKFFLIEELFVNFKILKLNLESSNINNLIYENLLIITQKKPPKLFFDNLKKNNHTLFICLDKQFQTTDPLFENENIKLVSAPIKINHLKDLVESFFNKKIINYNDLLINEEKITNIKNNKHCNLTNIENKILIELINKTKINRDYFLENILNINKEIETKTIESHLTRIRKKLYQIESNARISSKDNVFFLEFFS